MFLLRKFISYWLMPLQASLLLLVVGWWLQRTAHGQRWGRRLLLTGVIILALASNKGVGIALIYPLESRYPAQPEWPSLVAPKGEAEITAVPPTSLEALRHCQAIVVLGGGHGDTSAASATNRLSTAALGRLTEGVRLAHGRPDIPLVVSGPSSRPGATTHARVLRDAAVSLGIAPARIREIDTARDTEGEARATQALLGGGPVALVTSAWHMPRAVRYFERAGVEVVPCPADFCARLNDDFRLTGHLAWDISGLERSTRAIREYLGLAWGRLTGKL